VVHSQCGRGDSYELVTGLMTRSAVLSASSPPPALKPPTRPSRMMSGEWRGDYDQERLEGGVAERDTPPVCQEDGGVGARARRAECAGR